TPSSLPSSRTPAPAPTNPSSATSSAAPRASAPCGRVCWTADPRPFWRHRSAKLASLRRQNIRRGGAALAIGLFEEETMVAKVLDRHSDDLPPNPVEAIPAIVVAYEREPSGVVLDALVLERHLGIWIRSIDAPDETVAVPHLVLRDGRGEAKLSQEAKHACLHRALGNRVAWNAFVEDRAQHAGTVATAARQPLQELTQRVVRDEFAP